MQAYAEPWVPEGFGDFSDEEVSELSVYYNNQYLGDVVAEFDSDSVKILNSEVLESVLAPFIKDDYVVFNLLKQKMSANADMVCLDRNRQDVSCPFLEPHVVGVILDRNNYRLDMYFAPGYLTRSSVDNTIFYTKPTFNDLVYSSRFGMHFTGDMERVIADVINDQYVSKGPFNMHLNITYNHDVDFADIDYNGDFFLNYLNFNYEKDRRQYMFGFIPSAVSSYSSSGNIFGFGMSTMSRLMNNQNALIGTPFTIEISAPSTVTYYVNNQIVYTRRYNVGIFNVDPSVFPNGTYDIKAVIRDINDKVTTKTIPFVKSSADPLMGYPEYYFYLGLNRGQTAYIHPRITGDWLLSWSYAYRQNPKLALYFDFSWQDDAALFGFGPGFYWRKHQYFRPSMAYDTRAGFLYSFSSLNSWRKIHMNFLATKVRDGTLDTTELYSAAFSYNFGRFGMLGVNYSNSNELSYNYAVSRRFSYPGSWKKPFKFNVQLAHSSEKTFIALTSKKLLVNSKRHKSYLSSSVSQNSQNEAGLMYDHGLSYVYDYEYSPTAVLNSQLFLDEDSLGVTTSLKKKIKEKNMLTLRASMLYQFSGDIKYSYDIGLARKDSLGWIWTKNGFSFLWDMQKSTGALVSVNGLNNQDVVVSSLGREYKMNPTGKPTFIPLSVYKPSQVMIDYRGEQAFSFQGGEDNILLFPGNIANVTFEAKPVYTLFSSFSCAGEPLTFKALFSSVDSTSTDASGYASIEVTYDDVIELGGKYKGVGFSTEGLTVEDGFVYVDEMVCSQGESIVKGLLEAKAKEADSYVPFADEILPKDDNVLSSNQTSWNQEVSRLENMSLADPLFEDHALSMWLKGNDIAENPQYVEDICVDADFISLQEFSDTKPMYCPWVDKNSSSDSKVFDRGNLNYIQTTVIDRALDDELTDQSLWMDDDKDESLMGSSQSVESNEAEEKPESDNNEAELESKFQQVYSADQNTQSLYNYPTLMPSSEFFEREADIRKKTKEPTSKNVQ